MDTNIKPRTPIIMDSVESSQIAAIGHDPETNTLAVKFPANKRGISSVYHYANFDAAQFEAFKQAESKGSYFGQNIKRNVEAFPYENVTDLYADPAPEAA
ncbi:KTSC domain-containing protein [Pusillimonas noertemannii]|uniref:KTSC domain-containing protein n=1 Tax=Pusillimonas noertemannii TaxID=305977 RepID=A0A2U1CMI7_9BURK|nr:KTSC domain-containing protein [Pusillimonas noertemannii]NYT68762.1 KTSC domain-containing protein [Pusillimonas noertemannii]PVY62217.1 KTSC domain-containing protein [Pusillimonas noertemannii]TFL10803.1 KTSC domain-containing protein [Pusillimonas noertemannii]